MLLKVHDGVELECDSCGTHGPIGRDERDAREQAVGLGWAMGRGEPDHCRDCAENRLDKYAGLVS